MTEFKLDENLVIGRFTPTNQRQFRYYKEEDVKEFIRLDMDLIISCFVKKEIDYPTFIERREKLIGEKLQ